MAVTTKTMRLENIPRLRVFLDRRSHNWQERLRLITFLALCSLVILAGVPMHFFGLIGWSNTTLYGISAIVWMTTLAILVLYLRQRISLKAAVTSFGIVAQLSNNARIVHMVMTQPPGFEENIVFNQVISLALILYLVMASLKYIPTITASISIATIIFAYFYTGGRMNRQIAVIFIITEIVTCVLGELIRRGIRDTQRENKDYHDTLDRLLTTFHMTKTELLAYIQLGRGDMKGEDVSDFFRHLDERTEANLIRAVKQRMAQRKMQHADISATLPSLTLTEREVCRLIIGGKTTLEIATILRKKPNNISSVRIHIRKKLGLSTSDDLREELLKKTAEGH